MQNKSNKIILFALLGIAILASVFTIIFAAKVSAAKSVIVDEYKYSNEYFFQLMTGSNTDEVPANIQDAVQSARTSNTMFNVASTVLYILVAIAILAALVTFVKLLWTKRQSFVKTLLVAVILCVIFFVAWIFASSTDVSATMLEKYDVTQSGSKLVGAACISVYILFFASLLSIVYVEVAKLLKK